MRKISDMIKVNQKAVCVVLALCMAAVLTGAVAGCRLKAVDAKMKKTQEELAGEVFRFHVLANSDSDEDQRVKLCVRDAVLELMKTGMAKEYGEKPSADETKKWAEGHLEEIEEAAQRVIHEEGHAYGASAEVTVCSFPDKNYGDVTFPAGDYEALRIKLGSAEGHNWWCVLYPNLCFLDSTCAVVSEDGKRELKETLSAEEYEMVTATTDFKIKWFFFGDGPDKDQ